MAHILVIGASRGIGLETVRQALEAGHRVRGLSRHAEEIEIAHENFTPYAADATDAGALSGALEGIDAVIMALGITESVSMIWKHVSLFSDATRAILPLMEAQGPKRLIVVTGIGAGDSRSALSSLERAGHWALLGRPYADKTRQEEMIRASGLDWTIARPVILTKGKRTGTYKVLTDPASWRMGLISRADVADFLVRAVEDDSLIGTAPVLTR